MKAFKGETLSEVLSSLTNQGKRFGDVLLTNLKEKKGNLLLSFSKLPDKYILYWDNSIQ